MKTNHSDMDLIMCYVLKVTGEPLGKKLANEIKKDCIVISEMFPLGHLEEIKQIESSIYGIKEKIFVYKKPEDKKKISQNGGKKTESKAKKADSKTKKVSSKAKSKK